jgi:hypothetical protein
MKKLLLIGGLSSISAAAMAADPTDIAGVITAVDGYRTAGVVVAVALLLFVMGRMIVKKVVK